MPERSLRILILERDHHGHRLSGVRVLLDALAPIVDQAAGVATITIATTQAGFESEEFAHQIAPVEHRIRRHLLPPLALPAPALTVARIKLADWRRLIDGGRFDHVYVPYGDGLLQLLGAASRLPGVLRKPGSTVAETIMMRGGFAYPGARWRTRAMALNGIAYAPFERIHLIDPLPWQWLQAARPRGVDKVRLLPDPITPTPMMARHEARLRLGLPGDDALRWCGCVGQIDERKGLDTLIDAFMALPHAPDDRLLLAGRHSRSLRHKADLTDDPRIVSIDRYLDEAELVAAINALDLVVAPYPRFTGSASIVLRAAATARPVLGADFGWMQAVIPSFQLGTVCNVEDPELFAQALAHAIDNAAFYRGGKHGKNLVQYGRIDNAQAHWTALLRERLGLPQSPALTNWPIV